MMKINGLGFMGPSGDATPTEYAAYTRAQPIDALAPMQAYQAYKQTGQAPTVPGLYQSATAPSAPATPGTPMRFGGK